MTRFSYLIIAFLIVSLLIASMIYQNVRFQNQMEEANLVQSTLRHTIDSLFSRQDSLRHAVQVKDSLLAKCRQNANLLLDKWHIKSLQRQGLANPVSDLKEDLISKKKLIREKGVLGGEMQFYSKEDIYILNHKWVLAYYEDGHNAGAMLLEYRIGQGGEITWKVIRSTL